MRRIRHSLILFMIPAFVTLTYAGPMLITQGEPIPLRRDLFGVSLVYHFGGVRPENPELLRIVRQSGIRTVRIPGGTEMNFWNWKTGLPFPEEHLAKAGFNMDHRFVHWAAAGIRTIPEKLGGPLTVQRYVDFCRATETEPVWGVNISSATPEDTRAFAQRLQNLKAPARYFEFGNECWIRANVPGVETAANFVERCRAHSQALREILPDARIALSGSHTPGRPAAMARLLGLDPEPLWKNSWDKALAGADFADAVVTHHYIEPKQVGKMDTVTAEEFAAWCFASASALPQAFAKYYAENLPDKEVWLTEWNLDQDMFRRREVSDDDELARRYIPEHTLLHALVVADFLLNLAAVENPVSVANLYTLISGTATGAIQVKGDELIPRPQLAVFEMLKPVIDECDRIAPCTIEAVPNIVSSRPIKAGLSVDGVGAFVFLSGKETKCLAIINRTEERQSVTLPADVSQIESVDTLSGPKLLPNWNHPENPWPGAKWKPKVNRWQRHDVDGAALKIPARSFNILCLKTN